MQLPKSPPPKKTIKCSKCTCTALSWQRPSAALGASAWRCMIMLARRNVLHRLGGRLPDIQPANNLSCANKCCRPSGQAPRAWRSAQLVLLRLGNMDHPVTKLLSFGDSKDFMLHNQLPIPRQHLTRMAQIILCCILHCKANASKIAGHAAHRFDAISSKLKRPQSSDAHNNHERSNPSQALRNFS
jgi:hypothetical protein